MEIFESMMRYVPICFHGKEPYMETNDNGGFLWGLLGCCIPIVGLILFLVWKDQKPNTAKAAGIGALVSVIISVVFYIIYFVILGAAGLALSGM